MLLILWSHWQHYLFKSRRYWIWLIWIRCMSQRLCLFGAEIFQNIGLVETFLERYCNMPQLEFYKDVCCILASSVPCQFLACSIEVCFCGNWASLSAFWNRKFYAISLKGLIKLFRCAQRNYLVLQNFSYIFVFFYAFLFFVFITFHSHYQIMISYFIENNL